jgi:RNA polymerase sigma-70 factor (ECF subfamily)
MALDPSADSAASVSATHRVRLVQVLARHQVMILAYARAIVRDLHLAEDVYQEVAVILAQDPTRMPDEEAGLAFWLREITRRKALELLRKARRASPLDEDVLELMASDFEPTQPEALGDLRAAMAGCLERLPDDSRAIVTGRYADDLSCEDIAARAGRSVQGVYAVLKRMRLALQDCVERALVRPLEERR